MQQERICRPSSRRESRRQGRREIILSAATQSFLDHGYAGTTMSAIAAALGGSKGTLWSYFPSKEALFAAVVDHATAAFRARLTETLDPHDDFATALRRFCTRFLVKVTSAETIALYRLVVAEAGRFPEMGQIFYRRGPQLTQALLADFLAGAMERGLLRRADPACAARQLIGLCLSGCHQQLLMGVLDHANPELIEADIDRALTAFIHPLPI